MLEPTKLIASRMQPTFQLKCALFSTRGRVSLSNISEAYFRGFRNADCGITCNFMWDGRGRWVHNTWKSHVNGTFLNTLSKRPVKFKLVLATWCSNTKNTTTYEEREGYTKKEMHLCISISDIFRRTSEQLYIMVYVS